MNSERPKRRFWQLHLSTVVVLILVLGALLPENIGRLWYVYHFTFEDLRPADGTCVSRMSAGEMLLATVLLNVIVLCPTVLIVEWFTRRRDRQRAAKAAESGVPRE